MKTIAFTLLLVTSIAGAQETTAVPDNFKFTPALLTVNQKGGSTEKAVTTPGIEFSYERKFGNTVGASPWQRFAEISATGKMAFDRKQEVGDLIDVHVSGKYYRAFGARQDSDHKPIEGKGFFTAKFAGGMQADQKFDTKHNLLKVEAQGHYVPLGVPSELNYLIPYVTLGYERVNPSGDTARKAADPALRSFNRLHGMLAFSTIVGRMDTRDVKLGFKVDHWRERNASVPIVSAQLDRQTYRALYLHQSSAGDDVGWSISYSSGKVPTNQATSKVWALGYKLTLK